MPYNFFKSFAVMHGLDLRYIRTNPIHTSYYHNSTQDQLTQAAQNRQFWAVFQLLETDIFRVPVEGESPLG